MKIIEINENHPFLLELAHLAHMLWNDHSVEELLNEIKALVTKNNFYFGMVNKDTLVAFIQLSIRYEYVNGTSISPVGYIEGIFVKENHRRMHIGKQLVEHVIHFLKNKGIQEIASDTSLDNYESQQFHKNLGFQETERAIFYSKNFNKNQ